MKILVLIFYLLGQGVYASSSVEFINTRENTAKRIELIRNANDHVYLMYYIFNDDWAGRAVVDELIKAKNDRNIDIKIIFDEIGPGPNFANFHPLATRLRQNKIEVKSFNQSMLKVWQVDNRMHDKLLISDDKVMVGSSNIWSVANSSHFIQTDVIIEDSGVLNEATSHFKMFWNSSNTSEVEDSKKNTIKLGPSGSYYYINAKSSSSKTNKFFNLEIQYFHDSPDKDSDQGSSAKIIELIDSATDKIDIINTYVIPPKELREALMRARENGVEINIYTNNPQSIGAELELIADGYNSIFKYLLEMKANLYELRPNNRSFNHSKALIIDDSTLCISSFNFDNLSFKKNTENGIIISNIQNNSKLSQFIKDRTERLKQLSDLIIDSGKSQVKRSSLLGSLMRNWL